MTRRRRSYLPPLEVLEGPPVPDGFDHVVDLFHKAANAKRNGKPRKRERITRERMRAELLGEDGLTDHDRALLMVARSQVKLRARVPACRRILELPENRRLSWRAPDGGRPL